MLVLDVRNDVYGVKSVAAIPLRESQARAVLNTLSNKYNRMNTFPDHPAAQSSDIPASDPSDVVKEEESQPDGQPAKVKFSDNHDVKIMSPVPDSEFPSSSPASSTASSLTSGASTPVSTGGETSAVAKALASRLSFWNRLSHRQSVQLDGQSSRQLNDDSLEDPGEQDQALQEILETTSPVAATAEERQDELDKKILRQCIKEFTKGVMFFAYNFGELQSD